MNALTTRTFGSNFGVKIIGDCIRFGDSCETCSAKFEQNIQPSCSTVVLRLDLRQLPDSICNTSNYENRRDTRRFISGRRVQVPTTDKTRYDRKRVLSPFDGIDTALCDLATEVREILLFEIEYSVWTFQPCLFSHGNQDGWRWLYGIDCEVVNGTVARYYEKNTANTARDIASYKDGAIFRYERILSRMRLMFWTWRIRTSGTVKQYRDFIRREVFHEVFGNYPIDKAHILKYG